jgi:hypothetical protein
MSVKWLTRTSNVAPAFRANFCAATRQIVLYLVNHAVFTGDRLPPCCGLPESPHLRRI